MSLYSLLFLRLVGILGWLMWIWNKVLLPFPLMLCLIFKDLVFIIYFALLYFLIHVEYERKIVMGSAYLTCRNVLLMCSFLKFPRFEGLEKMGFRGKKKN